MHFSIRKQPPTREQIQMQIGDIEAKIVMLTGLNEAASVPGASDFVDKLNKNADTAKASVDEKTTNIQIAKLKCYEGNQESCDEYR